MELALEVLVLLLNVGLAVAALVLLPMLSGSVFASLPRYMLILAASLIAHASTEIFLSGTYEFFIYGLTASIATLSYLLLVYGLYGVLKNISASRSEQ